MMEEKALTTIRRHRLLPANSNVIVALSGGADSVALFHFLHSHRQALGIRLCAAHFEHGMRGQSSLDDAAFVEALCKQCEVTLYLEHGGMGQKERPKGVGPEEWARQLRYTWFSALAAQQQGLVALAHTASDNAETVLFHAVRGSGPKGLAGIPHTRDVYVRPLLDVSRKEVVVYCKANGLAYCMDETNGDNSYSRNRLRNKVMPQLEQVHPGARQSLVRLAADMRELDDWLAALAVEVLQAAVNNVAQPDAVLLGHNKTKALEACEWQQLAGSTGLCEKTLLAAPPPVRKKVYSMLVGPAATHDVLQNLDAVLLGEARAARLPNGYTALRRKGRLFLEPTGEIGRRLAYEMPLREGEHTLPGGYRISVKKTGVAQEWTPEKDKVKEIGRKSYTFVADYDKIYNCSVFRTRRPQDVFSPAKRGITQTVKKWMNEAGVPLAERDQRPLLAHEGIVYWIWDGGFCQNVQPGTQTQTLLVIEQKGRCHGEDKHDQAEEAGKR